MATSSYADLGRYRTMYNENKAQIEALQKELATWQKKLDDIEQAKAEAANDNATATDDYYRIPAIMKISLGLMVSVSLRRKIRPDPSFSDTLGRGSTRRTPSIRRPERPAPPSPGRSEKTLKKTGSSGGPASSSA